MSQACRALPAPSELTARVRASCRLAANTAITPSTHATATAHGRSRSAPSLVAAAGPGALSSSASERIALLALTCPIAPCGPGWRWMHRTGRVLVLGRSGSGLRSARVDHRLREPWMWRNGDEPDRPWCEAGQYRPV